MSYRVRNMEPRDLPAAWRLHRAQNHRDGTIYPFPEVFNPDGTLTQNVPLALVVERDGRVRRCFVFLRTVEIFGVGGGLDDMEIAAAHIPMALDYLRRRGYQDAHALVPAHRATIELDTLLAQQQMRRIDPRFATYFITL